MLENSIMEFIILNDNLNSTMTKNKLQKVHGQHQNVTVTCGGPALASSSIAPWDYGSKKEKSVV